jgi:hypothetical protein
MNTTKVAPCYCCKKLIRASAFDENEKRCCIDCRSYKENYPRVTFIEKEMNEGLNNINEEITNEGPNIVSYEKTFSDLKELYIPALTKKTLNGDDILRKDMLDLGWENQLAIQRVNEFVFRGFEPSNIKKGKNGYVIWDNLPGWKRLEIRDEAVLHLDSPPNIYIMFATCILNIPADKVDKIKLISPTITYNELTKEITSVCNFLGASIAIFAHVKLYAEGHYKIEDAILGCNRTIKRLTNELNVFEKKMNDINEFIHDIGNDLKETIIWERYVTGTNYAREQFV